MKLLFYPLMAVAACGLALSLAVHVMALAGDPIPGNHLVWGLHAGIFLVWIPTLLASIRTMRCTNRREFWKVMLAGCPPWMRRAVFVLFGYAIVNFLLFLAAAPSLQNQQEGDLPPAVLRGFSGHWMIFYAAAFAVLYSWIRAPQLYRERKCPNGHVVPATARFCPECGQELSGESGNA